MGALQSVSILPGSLMWRAGHSARAHHTLAVSWSQGGCDRGQMDIDPPQSEIGRVLVVRLGELPEMVDRNYMMQSKVLELWVQIFDTC